MMNMLIRQTGLLDVAGDLGLHHLRYPTLSTQLLQKASEGS